MDNISIIFSVKKIEFSRDIKEVNEKVLVFPEFLKDLISSAYMGKAEKVPQKELSYYGIEAYHYEGFLIIEKKIEKFNNSDVFIDRVYIKIPLAHINYLELEVLVNYQKNITRNLLHTFINEITENEESFSNFINSKKFDFKEKNDERYEFKVNKILKCFIDSKDLQAQYFTKEEIFLDENVSLKIYYRDELKRLVIFYEGKNNKAIYENDELKLRKVVFTKKTSEENQKSKRFRINFANIHYKIKGAENYINVKYNKSLSMNPKVDTEIYEIPINDRLGVVSVYFKENQYPPQIEGCTFSESFDNCGIGEVRCGKNFVEGRVILSSQYSNYLNMFLMEIVRKYKIKKEEVLHFLKELPADISEQEMIDLLELNYVSDVKDVNKVIEEKKSMDDLYKKVWSALQSDSETPEKIKAIEKTIREGSNANNDYL